MEVRYILTHREFSTTFWFLLATSSLPHFLKTTPLLQVSECLLSAGTSQPSWSLLDLLPWPLLYGQLSRQPQCTPTTRRHQWSELITCLHCHVPSPGCEWCVISFWNYLLPFCYFCIVSSVDFVSFSPKL